jgi:hypothetical protein
MWSIAHGPVAILTRLRRGIVKKLAQHLADISESHFFDEKWKLVKDHKDETDTKQAGSSFLREKSYVVAPHKRRQSGKGDGSCPMK